MKPNMLYFAAGALLLLVLFGAPGWAITVTVNGQPVPPWPPAVERQGRVLLPMRVVFESLGATVEWQAATRSATALRGDKTVEVAIGKRLAYVNRRPVALDVPPMLIKGVTYMPVRFPSEALGANVHWEEALRLVAITLPQAAAAAPAPPAWPQVRGFATGDACVRSLPAPCTGCGGTVTGVVVGLSMNQVAVQVGQCIETFAITPGTAISFLGRGITFGQLQLRDQVWLQYDGRRFALQIQAERPCFACQATCR